MYGGGYELYKSKLQICIEILCNLASNGPMNLAQLNPKVQLDITRLMPHLKLLKNRGLIDKQNLGEDNIIYVVTERGLRILKVIGPMIKEAHKIQVRNFATIAGSLSGAGYY